MLSKMTEERNSIRDTDHEDAIIYGSSWNKTRKVLKKGGKYLKTKRVRQKIKQTAWPL
jgi:hypothetical protein